jgi:CRP-like cAMP-binding protein/Ca2+/Na+ antiporter
MKTKRQKPPKRVLQGLSNVNIIRALPPEEIYNVMKYVIPVEFSKGDIIIKEGAEGDSLFFIDMGRVRVSRSDAGLVSELSDGETFGEAALLTGESRNASCTAITDVSGWTLKKADFDEVVSSSHQLKKALEELVRKRSQGIAPELPSSQSWTATALRAIEARYRGLRPWQTLMGIGLVAWLLLLIDEHVRFMPLPESGMLTAVVELVAGLMVLQGACEAFIQGVERLGARLGWDGFISGTIGSILSTLPEFVVIAFLVKVSPLAAIVTAMVTIFNNGLAFSIYSFFLPKDKQGVYSMPRSMTIAGGELLIAGGAVVFIVGLVMMLMQWTGNGGEMARFDLLAIGVVLLVIYVYYAVSLLKYYGEGRDDPESVPPDPDRLGHDTSWGGIVLMVFLGMLGSYAGGELIGGFADIAIKQLQLPTIPTAAALAFFGGVSEYIIVIKAHRRGELGIALSNVFGGLSQVMFLLLPFTFIVIGTLGLVNGSSPYAMPINFATTMLVVLLFPLFYALHQYVEQNKSLTNLGAAAMTCIYGLLLYFLFSVPS